tara:strand:+ start:178 stop:1185 length:1008 start_codon:yes stop_codon:yes gene_type:complete
LGIKFQKDFVVELPESIVIRIKKFLNTVDNDVTNLSDHWSSRESKKKKSFEIISDRKILIRQQHNGLDDYYPANFGYDPILSLSSKLKRKLLRFMRKSDNSAIDPLYNYELSKYKDYPLNLRNLKHTNYLNPSWVQVRAVLITNMLSKYFMGLKSPSILEIGPGSGNLIFCINSLFNSTTSYLLDLPSSLPFSIINLLNKEDSSKDCKFLLPNEIEENSNFDNYKYVFLTNQQIDLVKNNSIDIMINTLSFAEMLPENIQNYFIFLRRICKKNNFFYCLNRVEKKMYLGKNEYYVRFHEYPWSNKDEEILFRMSEIESIELTYCAAFEKLVNLSK